VIDGDTVEVRLNGGRPDVRLIGIDTPEVFGGEECGGQQASNSMKRMLDPGDRVTLIRDRSQNNRDAFGRLLRYIEDGSRDVGKAQVGRGWAKVVKFDGRFNRIRPYRHAQRSANAQNRGVWGCAAETSTVPSRAALAALVVAVAGCGGPGRGRRIPRGGVTPRTRGAWIRSPATTTAREAPAFPTARGTRAR